MLTYYLGFIILNRADLSAESLTMAYYSTTDVIIYYTHIAIHIYYGGRFGRSAVLKINQYYWLK